MGSWGPPYLALAPLHKKILSYNWWDQLCQPDSCWSVWTIWHYLLKAMKDWPFFLWHLFYRYSQHIPEFQRHVSESIEECKKHLHDTNMFSTDIHYLNFSSYNPNIHGTFRKVILANTKSNNVTKTKPMSWVKPGSLEPCSIKKTWRCFYIMQPTANHNCHFNIVNMNLQLLHPETSLLFTVFIVVQDEKNPGLKIKL